MSTIRVKCIDQTLVLESTPVIASGGALENVVSFSFCPLWDGFYKTAVFWRTEADPYHAVLDTTNSCAIPAEVLGTEGELFFGVFGVNDENVRRTSNVLRYNIVQGVITEDTQPADPTPDIYTQLLAAVASLGTNKGKADKVENATGGHLAGLDANGNLTDSGKQAADFVAATEKGVPLGVPTLDEGGKVPKELLPDLGHIPATEKAQPGGVATLNAAGKVPEEQIDAVDETVVWLVPYTYGVDPTVFDRPNDPDQVGSSMSVLVDLPKTIDFSKNLYKFSLEVYGLIPYGGKNTEKPIGYLYLVPDSDAADVETVILYSTHSVPSSGSFGHLTFPRFARYETEAMETDLNVQLVSGYYKGSMQTGFYQMSNSLQKFGKEQYNRAELRLDIGYDKALGYATNPIETFGVKLTYRVTGKRVTA